MQTYEIESIEQLRDYEMAIAVPTDQEMALARVRELSRICGRSQEARSYWLQVCPRTDGDDDLTLEEAEKCASDLARLKGWMTCAAALRLPGGISLAEHFRPEPHYRPGYYGNPNVPVGTSPHKLHRWAWAVYRRACEILRPYGWSPSRAAVGAAVISHGLRRVGRVALQVAAASLPKMFGGGLACIAAHGDNSPDCLPRLSDSRKVLVAARGWKALRRRWAHDLAVIATTCHLVRGGATLAEAEGEAVELYYSADLTLDEAGVIRGRAVWSRHGIKVYRCWQWTDHRTGLRRLVTAMQDVEPRDSSRWDWRQVWLVAGTAGQTYHSTGWDNTRMAREALEAWGEQRKAARKVARAEADILATLHPQGPAMVIVRLDDSLRAGNCEPGSRYWASQHGYHGAMPYAVAARYAADDHRVARVLAGVGA